MRGLWQYWRSLFIVLGFTAGGSLVFYTYTTYMQKYLVNTAGMDARTSSRVMTAALFAFMLLQPLFGDGKPTHVDHLTWFTAESFGGPDRFTRELGFWHLVSVHRGLKITEEQRQRFVELYLAALDKANMPADPEFRQAVREHVEFGSRVAMQNSHAATDQDLHPLRDVPRWTWAGDDTST